MCTHRRMDPPHLVPLSNQKNSLTHNNLPSTTDVPILGPWDLEFSVLPMVMTDQFDWHGQQKHFMFYHQWPSNSGWWLSPTPLKNDGARQLGWWHSQYVESHEIHVPKHQPEFIWPKLHINIYKWYHHVFIVLSYYHQKWLSLGRTWQSSELKWHRSNLKSPHQVR